jgi:protein-S-isoprenylcysteine O-methyltransferase Ste14
MFFRHLLAIIVFPVVATVLVPVWIIRRYTVPVTGPSTVLDGLFIVAGIIALGAGLALFLASLFLFATRGRGTLAPWDPLRRLVVSGPYRFVRNAMISGVMLILIAEALLLGSGPHAVWAGLFAALSLVYIPLLEEPPLRARFGKEYRQYSRHVPRFLPRIRPWSGPHQ